MAYYAQNRPGQTPECPPEKWLEPFSCKVPFELENSWIRLFNPYPKMALSGLCLPPTLLKCIYAGLNKAWISEFPETKQDHFIFYWRNSGRPQPDCFRCKNRSSQSQRKHPGSHLNRSASHSLKDLLRHYGTAGIRAQGVKTFQSPAP